MEIKPSGCNVHCANTQMKILLTNGKKGLRGAPAGRGDAAAADEVDEGDGSCGHEVPGAVLSSLHTENHTVLGTTPRSRCYSPHFTDAETETQSLKDVPRGTRSTEGRGVKRAPSGSRAQTRNRACYRRPVLLENYCGLRSGGPHDVREITVPRDTRARTSRTYVCTLNGLRASAHVVLFTLSLQSGGDDRLVKL